MKREHKAIIDQAKKEGKLPMEYSHELVVHDMVESMRDQMSNYEVGYKKMTEKQQDAVLGELQASAERIAGLVARVVSGAGSQAVQMKLKDLKVSNGQLTGTVSADAEYFNELIAKVQDKSEVLIVLYPRDFNSAMDDIQSEKDQRALDLSDKPASKPRAGKAKAAGEIAKAIELPPKFLNDARDFVTIQQNASIAGLQNQMKCGFEKAVAALDVLASEGHVIKIGEGKDAKYELKRDKVAPEAAQTTPDLYGELTYSEVCQTVVLHSKSFELAWLVTRFKIDQEKAEHLALKLLNDGVVDVVAPTEVEGAVTYSVIAKLEDLEI